MPMVSLTVNGKAVRREVEGRTLLNELLRQGLGLTGAHVGCDTSQCGACVVHVDGAPVKSCSVFALDLEGAEVRTIEAMANPDGTLGVVQAAFREHHGLQCGFCTPGMVMTAAALTSIPSIRPCARSERRKCTWACPGRLRSSTYRPLPVRNRTSSRRLLLAPIPSLGILSSLRRRFAVYSAASGPACSSAAAAWMALTML